MRMSDTHYMMSFPAELQIGIPSMRRATPQEEERNVLQREDQRLEKLIDRLGHLALRDIFGEADVEFTAARREAISLREKQVRAWMGYYERYPVIPMEKRMAGFSTELHPRRNGQEEA